MLIGIKGKIGVGKDTVGDYLQLKYKFKKVSFSAPLKQIVSIITGWPIELLLGNTPESREFRETVVHSDFNLTGRQLLQNIGTNVFRDNFDKDIWIKVSKREIKRLLDQGINVVITDVRFGNESQMIQELGGKIWKISRETKEELTNSTTMHASENEFSTDGEIIIKNNKTIEDLYKIVDTLIVF